MEQNNKWSSAAMDGLILSVVTIIYSLILLVFPVKGFIVALPWVVKFAASNYLLYYFMKKYASQFENISYGASFNYGVIVSMFSAIICACFSFFNLTVLFPDSLATTVEQMQQVMAAQSMNQDQEAMFGKWMERLPEISLFANLIYYTLYGVIASSIIANFTKKTDPFAGKSSQEF